MLYNSRRQSVTKDALPEVCGVDWIKAAYENPSEIRDQTSEVGGRNVVEKRTGTHFVSLQ